MKIKDPVDEILVILMEECAEVQKVASKMLRFGVTNEKLQELEAELGDLTQMIDLLHKFDMVSYTNIEEHSQAKYQKLKKFSNIIIED